MAIHRVRVFNPCNPCNPQGPKSKFRHERIESPSKFDKRSFRVVRNAGERIVVGCPKGKYSPRTGRCKVGMRPQAILYPKQNQIRIPRTLTRIARAFSSSGSGSSRPVRHHYQCVGGQKVRMRRRPRIQRFNQSPFTDAIATQIASKVAGMLTHSRASPKRKGKKVKRKRSNPYLAIIGPNPKGKRRTKKMATRRRRFRRNAKGQFLKRSSPKHRRRRSTTRTRHRRKRSLFSSNPRRRRHTRATSRRRRTTRRRRNKSRVIVVNVHPRRRRYNKMAAKRRKRTRTRITHRRRSTHRVRHRRRNYTRATNRHHRRRNRRYGRRRNPMGLGPASRVPWKQVAFVAAGVFVGDKVSGWATDMVMGYVGGYTGTSETTRGIVKLFLGATLAGVVWGYQPAFGMGVAVGAANALLNQYILQPLWGYVTPYLPGGMAGLGEYQTRSYKMDNWIGSGQGAVAGLGNPLLSKGL